MGSSGSGYSPKEVTYTSGLSNKSVKDSIGRREHGDLFVIGKNLFR